MMTQFLLSLLVLSGGTDPEVTLREDGRLAVRIVYEDNGAMAHAQAQIALIRAAEKACRGKGNAVSESGIEVNTAPPTSKGRKALELIEVYRCVPKSER